MPGIVIRGLSEALHRRLRLQAERHHRSMTKEVLAVLEQALPADPVKETAAPPFKGRFALTDRFLGKARREGRG